MRKAHALRAGECVMHFLRGHLRWRRRCPWGVELMRHSGVKQIAPAVMRARQVKMDT